MSEGKPNQPEKGPTKKEQIIALAIELSKSDEVFPFSGISPRSYASMKALDRDNPGLATPIDELVRRFENEGMKVVLGKYPKSGNVFILPAQSDDIENDSVFPRHLLITEGMNERLKELVRLMQS